jgi:tetratricopeptide (TPR) repeat protein
VSLPLKSGDLGALEAWVKKGDVFAVVQIRESKKVARPAKSKDGKGPPPGPAIYGTRLDGVLLQVVERPPAGVVVCRVYNRYQGALPRDASTLGYRCVKLGTAEGPLKLQLLNAGGQPHKGDELQVRGGVVDYPVKDREGSEFFYADSVFASKDPFSHIAFIMVKSGNDPVARIPVEVYADQVVQRRVTLNPKSVGRSYFSEIAGDLLDRIRSARVVQASSFEEIVVMQKTDKQKALDFAQKAYESQRKDYEGLQAEVSRLRQRFAMEAPPGSFDACDTDLRALEQRARQLRTHMDDLKNVIRLENDPNVLAQRKNIEGMLVEAKGHITKADYDQAIAKYEEALKLVENDPTIKAGLQMGLDGLKKDWEIKDADHGTARKFIYETWVKLEKSPEVRERLAEARKAFEKCKAVNDLVSLRKMYLTAPQVLERYSDNLKMLADTAMEDEEKQALLVYVKVTEDLTQLVTDVGKAIGADVAPPEKK